MKSASYAPIYCSLYPDLAQVVRTKGYALCVHGSMQRDFDLVCIPWVKNPAQPEEVVETLTKSFELVVIGDPVVKFHGRKIWTLSLGFGECFLDLSFMPIKEECIENTTPVEVLGSSESS